MIKKGQAIEYFERAAKLSSQDWCVFFSWETIYINHTYNPLWSCLFVVNFSSHVLAACASFLWETAIESAAESQSYVQVLIS